MALSAKYFITDPQGNYIDWSAAISGFSLLGKEIQLIGGAGGDILYVQAGTSADATNLDIGNDLIYLSGNLADYTQSINQDTLVFTLSRDISGQTEVVKFTVADQDDVVYFADGHIVINGATNSQLYDGTLHQIQSGWLTPGGSPASPVTTAVTTATNPTKVFIVDAQGLDVPMLMQPGQAMTVTGSGGVDTVYVGAGTSIDATNLDIGNDRIYLTGNLADYTQSINQDTLVFTLSRDVSGQTELVKFTVADQDDAVYFADGHIIINGATNSQLYDGTLHQIQTGWLVAGATPLPGPTVTITSNDSSLTVGETATITFTLNEAATDFTAADVTVSAGGLTAFSGSGTTYTATFTPPASTDASTVTIGVAGGTFTNAEAQNNSAGSLALSVDTNAPTLAITSNVGAVKVGETATVTFTFSETPTGFAAADVVTTGGTLSDPAVTADPKIYTASFTPTAGFEGNASITVASGVYTDAAGNTGGAGTTPAVAIDTLAPTTTLTSAVYNDSTGVLTVTGTNLDTLGVANGTDVKTQLDWTKLSWDINGDNTTTADKTFVSDDIASAVVSNATTLTITLASGAKTALEGMTGFGTTGGSDKLDVTAGFIKDAAGNAAATDALTNGSLQTDSTPPTTTLTSAAYNNGTGVLTVTGTNLDTLGVANGTDVKSYLDWAKLAWDINGDGVTTADKTFVVGDITSAVVTSATTLTITLGSAAKAALEGTAGFGAAGGV
ncbi:MAG: Ig-like domain-containing protein, partial [Pseudomonadota bacterium]